MYIAYCPSEMALFAKIGGLADVSAALPKSLVGLGHHVFPPHYGSIALPPGEFMGSVHLPVDALPRAAPV
jgi:glycogen synthase